MRYLIDTNIFVYFASDLDLLNRDVLSIMSDYDTVLYMSAESVKELIVAFRTKKLLSKRWKNELEMIRAIEEEFFIQILPIKKEDLKTYAQLQLNEAQGHKDPSDHIIIAQAITEHIPLISSDTRFPFYRAQGLDLVYNTK
ncbi:MAG: type II toxin-antitoxin system VapC family toxin [Paludibacteraceae bacterium]|nr:type II toxin-antitoxin system VapC family toxin [Paludibacteraceae bacterium]